MPKLTKPMLVGLIPLAVSMTVAQGMAASAWFLWYLPAETRLAERDAAYQSAKQAQARLQSARTMQELVKAAQQQVESQHKTLPTEHEFSSLSMAISELGQAERVLIPGMTYSLQKKERGLPVKATMMFKATGDYAAIFRFIQRLERIESYLVVESLDASRVDRHEQAVGAQVVFNMKVATFLRSTSEGTKETKDAL